MWERKMANSEYYIFWSVVTLIVTVTMTASVLSIQLNGC